MDAPLPEELQALADAFDANERDARALASELTEPLGTWRSAPDSWSVAECLDHLATSNRVYVAAMQPPAEAARLAGRSRKRPAVPGVVGGLFAKSLEPPAKPLFKLKAPRKIRPRLSPPFHDAFDAFIASHRQVRAFLNQYAGIDLAGVRFPNPFIGGLAFSLATGLHVLAAHERRHLWQGWRVRRAAEQSPASR